jgi:CRISPR/Cas system CSM-associated protein Csm3 (group 7 of RAMP superfamily)
MNKVELVFDILSYWHAGSGFAEGANLDARVLKTSGNLPYIPGKTVKGLLREAFMTIEELNQLPKDTTERVFGSNDPDNLSRYDTTAGLLSFTDAIIERQMEEWAAKHTIETQVLYNYIPSTMIDENGLAKEHSLRRIEVAIPIRLTSHIEWEDENLIQIEQLRMAASLVRHLGSHRHRGFGRVSVEVSEVIS